MIYIQKDFITSAEARRMTYVHERSVDCLKSELDLFEAPPTQTSLEYADWQEYPPHASLTANGPLEFYVSGSGDDYIDLMHTMLYVKVRIVDSTGVAVSANLAVAPVNNFLHSLFSQVEVQLNGRAVGHNNSLYAYRALIEKMLNYGSEAAHGHLQSELFYKDTAGFMDNINTKDRNWRGEVNGFNELPAAQDLNQVTAPGAAPIADAGPVRVQLTAPTFGNEGLHWRWLHSRGSQWFELMGPIHADVFQQEKFLLNRVDLAVKLTRAKPEFCLMSGEDGANFRVEIADALLYIRKVKLSDHVFLAHQQALLSCNAIYPTGQVVMKSFSIPAGNLHGPQDNIFLGQLPQEMVVAFVDNDAQNGNYKKNPFNFKHFDVQNIAVKYNGRPVPAHALSLRFSDTTSGGGSFLRALQQLYTGTGRLLNDKGSLVQRADFPRGYAIYVFDFRPDIDCRGHYELKKSGAVQVEVQFGTALTQTINMIVYGSFDSYFEVTQSREIIAPS